MGVVTDARLDRHKVKGAETNDAHLALLQDVFNQMNQEAIDGASGVVEAQPAMLRCFEQQSTLISHAESPSMFAKTATDRYHAI